MPPPNVASLNPSGVSHRLNEIADSTAALDINGQSNKNVPRTVQIRSPTAHALMGPTTPIANPSLVSTVPASRAEGLRIIPDHELLFQNYKPGEVVQTELRIVNLSQQVKKLTIEPPRSRFFQLTDQRRTEFTLACGLEVVIQVEFHAPVASYGRSAKQEWQLNAAAAHFLGEAQGGGSAASKQHHSHFTSAAPRQKKQDHPTTNDYDPSERLYHDQILISIVGQKTVRIPLRASPAAAMLDIVERIDFGVVVIKSSSEAPRALTQKGRSTELLTSHSSMILNNNNNSQILTHTQTIEVTNQGHRSCDIRVMFDESLPIRVTPRVLMLEGVHSDSSSTSEMALTREGANKRTNKGTLTLEYTPINTGPFDARIHLHVQTLSSVVTNQTLPYLTTHQYIRVRADVSSQKLKLVSDSDTALNIANVLNLGNVYYGERRSMNVRLLNQGPMHVHYVITPLDDVDKTTGQDGLQEDSVTQRLREALVIQPAEGELPPNGEVVLNVTWSPLTPPDETRFAAAPVVTMARLLDSPFMIQVVGQRLLTSTKEAVQDNKQVLIWRPTGRLPMSDPITFQCKGHVYPVTVSAHPRKLVFGKIKLGDQEKLTLTFRNDNAVLPVELALPKMAHFSFSQQHLSLEPGQESAIQVLFYPRQLGHFNSTLTVPLRSKDKDFTELATIVINLEGECPVPEYNPIKDEIYRESKSTALVPVKMKRRQSTTIRRRRHSVAATPVAEGMAEVETVAVCEYLTVDVMSYEAVGLDLISGKRVTHMPLKQDADSEQKQQQSIQDQAPVGNRKPSWWRENPERTKLVQNRQNYIQYLRDAAGKRIIQERRKKVGHASLSFTEKDLLVLEDIDEHHFDIDTGLHAPEPELPVILATNSSSHKKKTGLKDAATTNILSDDQQQSATSGVTAMQLLQMKLIKTASQQAHAYPDSTGGDIRMNRETEMHLSGVELAKIMTSVPRLSFGTVVLHTSHNMALNFMNGTNGAIRISLNLPTSSKYSLVCQPTSQVIPKKSIGGFNITFQSKEVDRVDDHLGYTINGRHHYQLSLLAVVHPVTIQVSRTDIHFGDISKAMLGLFQHVIDKIHAEETLTLTNTCTVPAKFVWRRLGDTSQLTEGDEEALETALKTGEWPKSSKSASAANNGNAVATNLAHHSSNMALAMRHGSFVILPLQGQLAPGESCSITVRYQPGSKTQNDELWQLDIDDGKPVLLRLRGQITPTKCTLSTKECDFGQLPLSFRAYPEALSALPEAVQHFVESTGVMNDLPASMATTREIGHHNTTTSNTHHGTSLLHSTTASLMVEHERTVRLRNVGSIDTTYQISIPSTASKDIQVFPIQGILANGASVDLVIRVLPTRLGKSQETLLIHCLGSKSTKLTVSFEAVQPRVVVQEKSIPMGASFVGTSLQRSFNLTNTANVTAHLLVNLTPFPDFSLALAPVEAISSLTDKDKEKLGPVEVNGQWPELHELTELMANKEKETIDVSAKKPIPSSTASAPSEGRLSHSLANLALIHELRQATRLGGVYRLKIPGHQSVQLQLTFRPTKAKTYRFILPLLLLGTLNWSQNEDEDLATSITAVGHLSPVVLSREVIAFKNKVVYTAENSLMTTLFGWETATGHEVVSVTSHWKEPIQWHMESVANNSGSGNTAHTRAFRFEPNRGQLEPGETIQLHVYFQPSVMGPFHEQFLLRIDHEAMKQAASFPLNLTGTGIEPSLIFDPPEVYLPTVPLGVEAMAAFSIVNYGCERGELKLTAPPDAQRLHLEVSFPEGRLLKAEGEKLLVLLRCRCDKPISFTTYLEFNVLDKRKFTLLVHGTSDSCLLTTFHFVNLTRHPDRRMLNALELNEKSPYGLSKEDLLSTKRNRMNHSIVQFQTPGGLALGTSHNANRLQYLDQLEETLLIWCRDNLNLSAPLSPLPGCFIQSHGRLLFELIQTLAGKKNMPMTYKPLGTVSREERVLPLERQYSVLLNYLRVKGALLNGVKAEYLLSLEDYKQLQWYRLTGKEGLPHHALQQQQHALQQQGSWMNQTLGSHPVFVPDEHLHYLNHIEDHYSILSRESWFTVLFQTIKLFALERVTLRSLRWMPGLVPEEDETLLTDATQTGNALFSSSEAILLRWVAHHYLKRTGKHTRLTNFEESFRDGVLLAHLILSHVPTMEDTHFKSFEFQCTREEHCRRNAEWVCEALLTLFPGLSMRPERIYHAFSYDILFLLLHLYFHLPPFLPKETVLFEGSLHATIQRQVEIYNPLNRTVTYTVHLEGSRDFSCPEQAFHVPAKSSVMIPLHFFARFTQPAQGQCTLRTKKTNLEMASVIAFTLQSKIAKPVPQETLEVEAALYQMPALVVPLEIRNPYSERAQFKIYTRHRVIPQFAKATRKQDMGVNKIKGSMTDVQAWMEEDRLENDDDRQDPSKTIHDPPAFRLTVTEIALEGHGVAKCPLTFLPFEHGLHELLLYLVDENVGECLIQVLGKTLLPAPLETWQWSCKTMNSYEKPLRVSAANIWREKALQYVNQTWRTLRRKTRESLGVAEEKLSLSLPPLLPFEMNINTISNNKKPIKFRVEYSSPHFKGPNEWTLHGRDTGDGYAPGELHVSFSPKLPGKYNCMVLIQCAECNDIRVYQLECTVMSEGSQAELDFSTPARQALHQEIPLVNKSHEPWHIRASLQTRAAFSGPPVMVVPASSTVYYPLLFMPTKKGEYQGHLSLVNTTTGQTYSYLLRGEAEEPFPEQHFQFTCHARQQVSHVIHVKNPLEEEMECDVYSSLPNTVCRNSVVLLGGGQVTEFKLAFQPMMATTHVLKESVSFVSKQDQQTRVWYTFEVQVLPAPADGHFKLSTTLYQPIALTVQCKNPLEKAITYQVQYQGQGLQGPSSIQVDAFDCIPYELIYTPQQRMDHVAGSLTFIHPQLGSFWYSLELEAKEAPPLQLPIMQCALGEGCQQTIQLENPWNEGVQVKVVWTGTSQDFALIEKEGKNESNESDQNNNDADVSNNANNNTTKSLMIYPSLKQFYLDPLSTKSLSLCYWPSHLTSASMNAVVEMKLEGHAGWGVRVYHIKGKCILGKQEREPLYLTCPKESVTVGRITIFNPFHTPVQWNLQMLGEVDGSLTVQSSHSNNPYPLAENNASQPQRKSASKSVMNYSRQTLNSAHNTLHNNNTNNTSLSTIAARTFHTFSIQYNPKEMKSSHVTLLVTLSPNDFLYRLPIHASPYLKSTHVISLETKQRQILMRQFIVPLIGLIYRAEEIPSSVGALESRLLEHLTFSLDNPEIQCQPSKLYMELDGTFALSFKCRFAPSQVQEKQLLSLIVTDTRYQASWHCPIAIQVKPCPLDDTLHWQSHSTQYTQQSLLLPFSLEEENPWTFQVRLVKDVNHSSSVSNSISYFEVMPNKGNLIPFPIPLSNAAFDEQGQWVKDPYLLDAAGTQRLAVSCKPLAKGQVHAVLELVTSSGVVFRYGLHVHAEGSILPSNITTSSNSAIVHTNRESDSASVHSASKQGRNVPHVAKLRVSSPWTRK